jgi:hypothetical protein
VIFYKILSGPNLGNDFYLKGLMQKPAGNSRGFVNGKSSSQLIFVRQLGCAVENKYFVTHERIYEF